MLMQCVGILPYKFTSNKKPVFSPFLFSYSLFIRSISLSTVPLQLKRMMTNPWDSVGAVAYDLLMTIYVTSSLISPLIHLFFRKRTASFIHKFCQLMYSQDAKNITINWMFLLYALMSSFSNLAMQNVTFFYPDTSKVTEVYWRLIVSILTMDLFTVMCVTVTTFSALSHKMRKCLEKIEFRRKHCKTQTESENAGLDEFDFKKFTNISLLNCINEVSIFPTMASHILLPSMEETDLYLSYT